MLVSIGTIGSGLLVYLLLALITAGAGLGLIRLTGLRLSTDSRLALAPVVTLAFWAVGIGTLVGIRVPVRLIWGPLWLLSLALAIYGLGSLTRELLSQYVGSAKSGSDLSPPEDRADDLGNRVRADWGTILVVVSLPVVVPVPYFLTGLQDHQGSVLPDGWSYVAFGQYLWEQPKGATGGLSPLHQYASHLSQVRYIASSLLGFFSPIFHAGDTQRASGLFLSWALLVFTSACAFFGIVYHLRRYSLIAFLLLSVVSGWIFNLIWANNYDNALALAYFPALVGLARIKPKTTGSLVLAGLLGAGLLYCYPELAIVVLGASALVFLNHSWLDGDRLIRMSLSLGIICLVITLLTAPFLADLISFFEGQAAIGLKSIGRPGEGMFSGLMSIHLQPSAFWAMGGEYGLTSWLPGGRYQIEEWLPVRNLVAGLFSGLLVVGFMSLWNKNHIGMFVSLVVVLAGALFFIVVVRYPYGAYKIIVLGWWAICFCLIRGYETVAGWLGRPGRRVTEKSCVLLWLVALPFEATAAGRNFYGSMVEYRKVEQVKTLTEGKSIVVAVDDWVANQWAVYFLRNDPIIIECYRMYMAQPHVLPAMRRARVPPLGSSPYLLTDNKFDPGLYEAGFWSLVWSGGPYRLWTPARADWLLVTDLVNPNGLEQLDGRQFWWLGNAPAVVRVTATKSAPLEITADFVPGPSLPERAERDLLVTSDGFARRFSLGSGNSRLVVPVRSGRNEILLQVLDRVSVPVTSGGDTRQLLLGVKGPKLKFAEAHATIEKIENRNGLEQVDGRPFFWAGSGDTKIRVLAERDGILVLTGTFVAGPNIPDRTDRNLVVTSNAGYRRKLTAKPGERKLGIPARQGVNEITLRVLDKATVAWTRSADPRPLLLGIGNLSVSLHDGPAVIESVENPNGLEQLDGGPFFWVGNGATTIGVYSTSQRSLNLHAHFILGPSLPDVDRRRVLITTDHGYRNEVSLGAGEQSIKLPIGAGSTTIRLKALDTPTVALQPNGDRRPLLLGVRGLKIQPDQPQLQK